MAEVDWLENLEITAETLAVSPAGQLYVGGMPSPATKESGAVLSQYDVNGQQQWQQTLPLAAGSTTTHLTIAGDCIYALGTVPVQTTPHQTTPDQNIPFPTTPPAKATQTEVWLAEYNRAGEQQWLHKLRSVSPQQPDSLVVDGQGFLYIAGHTTPEDKAAEGWLAKYDPDGDRLWQTALGNYSHPLPLRLWLGEDPTARTKFARIAVYTAGSTAMPLALPPGAQPDEAADEVHQSWLARYSSEGIQRWITALGPTPEIYCTALTTDANHHLYVAGQADKTDAMAVGPWLAQYDAQGQPAWQTTLNQEPQQAIAGLIATPTGLTLLGLSPTGQVWLAKGNAEGKLTEPVTLAIEMPVAKIKGVVAIAADQDENVTVKGIALLGQTQTATGVQHWLARVSL
ncbi:MAG: hypothetical protein ACPGVO_12625 [Spirulinaceae cyanobacterium]